MHEIHEHRLDQSRVTAVFEDRALSFILAKGATLEELSDRLADLGQRQERRPVAITVKFGAPTHKEAVNGSRDAQVGMSTLREGQESFLRARAGKNRKTAQAAGDLAILD